MGARRRRPAFRYHGGKWKIAKWVIKHLPPHETYVEPFGGGASVLLQKPIVKAELYNDLNDVIVSFFRVIQDPAKLERLIWLLERTPYSRREFELAYEPCEDDVEAARRMLIRSWQGYGSDGTDGKYKTGFRRTVSSVNKFPSGEWANYPPALSLTAERFDKVVVESMDAFDLMLEMDDPDTLFYVDPPYLPSTRSAGNRRRGQGFHVYAHELEEDDHVRLLQLLLALKGMVVLSGYPSTLYDVALDGWRKAERDAHADGGSPRTEVLWINPAASKRLDCVQPDLLEGGLHA